MVLLKLQYAARRPVLNFQRRLSLGLAARQREEFADQNQAVTRQVKGDEVIHNINSFQLKSTKDLLRTWFILKVSSYNTFVDHSGVLLTMSKKLLGEYLFGKVLRATFYGQFAGGETWDGLKMNASLLKQNGIRSMLCIPNENTNDNNLPWKEVWQGNAENMKTCIETTEDIEKGGFSQIKLSALCSHDLLTEMTNQLIAYEYDHQEPREWNIQRVGQLLKTEKYEDIEIPSLSTEKNIELREALQRIDNLAKDCRNRQLRFMVDAEQTYIQSALGYLILLLQQKYNENIPVVYNTYQCYRKDTLTRIQADYKLAKENGFKIACKLVRGAYMVEERRIAAGSGKEDPICDGSEKTTDMYHSVLDFVLPLIKSRQVGVMIASHNESTALYTLNRMQEMGLERNNDLLCFAQLYGMSDHLTEGLAKLGCQVYKSVPYGTIDSTLLYLVRRAQENRSVLQRGEVERKLILGEVFQRLSAA